MLKMIDLDDLVYWCWDTYSGIKHLNEVIIAENESRLYSSSHVSSPVGVGEVFKDAVSQLDGLPGEPEKLEELRSKLTAAYNAGLYFSLRLMNSSLALHDVGPLLSMSSAASEYAKCLKKLGLDVPKEALYIDSKTEKQVKRLQDSSVKEDTKEWLASWINRDEAGELRTAVIDLYNSLVSVHGTAEDNYDAVDGAYEEVRRQLFEGRPLWKGIDANELEDLLSNVEMYLSANSKIHTMISNAQKALEGKDWYKQEFELIERPAWAKKKS